MNIENYSLKWILQCVCVCMCERYCCALIHLINKLVPEMLRLELNLAVVRFIITYNQIRYTQTHSRWWRWKRDIKIMDGRRNWCDANQKREKCCSIIIVPFYLITSNLNFWVSEEKKITNPIWLSARCKLLNAYTSVHKSVTTVKMKHIYSTSKQFSL